ncbi:hypothetical protein LAZ67_6000366 [Cordylochernes scorpioides]|uniref:Uncharacterized protein n=1 Tax=Cordylochernes scorpioides TaxID=51811 RepID=A0ABY6KM63_9ARAC|nr:hypothetical protein LAZ67_6000366 [Cordylochernes scorpioides]
MNSLIVLLSLAAVTLAQRSSISMSSSGAGNYQYKYQIGDEGGHMREESRVDGAVIGKYSYIDANGDLREVRYRADATGYHPEGDISVDKKTAAYAAAMADLAPKPQIVSTPRSCNCGST